MELLKDIQSKKDLIIRLITHDISQENLENEESLASDEDEVVFSSVQSLSRVQHFAMP